MVGFFSPLFLASGVKRKELDHWMMPVYQVVGLVAACSLAEGDGICGQSEGRVGPMKGRGAWVVG